MIRGNTSFFITGGTLGQDTPSYVERQADTELYEGLRQGEFCYVLTARQMGKSSLMVRTANRLREEGFAVVTLDLTMVGQNLSLEQWYYGLLNLTGRQLGLRAELRAFWVEHPELGPLQRFMQALEQVVLASLDRQLEPDGGHGSRALVVFVDEIDSVLSLPFNSDELFAAIRQCYNRRAEEPALRRLTFCLLGVTSPSQLIRDVRTTPFNVGRRIELHDFREAEAQPLAVGLRLGAAGDPLRSARVAQRLLRRVLHWTAGHPYLTQRLCREVAEEPKVRDARAVDRLCRGLFLTPGARSRDDNLLFVQERLVNREDDVATYLDLYRRIRSGQRVRCDETDPRVPELRLSGIVREERGYLRVRNRIYHQVFDPTWIAAHLPDAELHRQLAAYRRGMLRGGVLASAVIAALGALAGTALTQSRRAERLLAEMQIDRGVGRLEAGDGLGLLDLADAYRTATGNPDLRRSAAQLWSGWHPLMRRRLLGMVGQRAPIEALCFTAQGRRLLTAASDGSAQLWDTATWRPVGPTFQHGEAVYSVAADARGSRLVTQGPGGVKWWDLSTGRALGHWSSRAEVCTAATLSHHGARLACADGRGVTVRSLTTAGSKPLELPGRGVLSLAFSADDRLLYVGGMQGLEVWDLASPQPQRRLVLSGSAVEWLTLGPQDRWLATAGRGQARFWQLPLAPTSRGELQSGEAISQVLFQPPAGAEAALLGRNQVRFSALPGLQAAVELPLWPGASHGMAFSPAGDRLATAGNDGAVRIWETRPQLGREVRVTHPASILAVTQWGADRVDTISADGYQRSWSVTNGAPLSPPLRLGDAADGASLDAEHRRLALWKGRQLWLSSLDARPRAPALSLDAPVEAVSFLPEGRTALLVTQGRPLRLVDAASGVRRGELPAPGALTRGGAQPSPDGRTLALLHGAEVRFFSTESGQPQGPPLTHLRRVGSFAFGAGGKLLASSSGATVQLWNTLHKPLGPPIPCPATVWRVALSRNEEYVAAATVSGEVRCWQTRTRQPVGVPLETSEHVAHLLFDPQGHRLVTLGLSSMRLWDLNTGKPVGPPVRLPAQARSAQFSADGGTLILACGRELRLWHLPTPVPAEEPSEAAATAALGVRRTPGGDLVQLGWQDFRRLRETW